MQHITEGFLNFQKEVFSQCKEPFRSLVLSQNPKALFTSYSDGRLVPELVTQQDSGQPFVIRNAGNVVPLFGPEPGGVSVTVEYAIVALGVTDIVICGHSSCGAMKAIVDSQPLNPMPAVAHWLHCADTAKAVVDKKTWDSSIDKVSAVAEENVIAQLNNTKTHPCVVVGLHNSALRLYGWVYDIESGKIRTLGKNSKTYVLPADNPQVHFEQFPHWSKDAPDISSSYFCQWTKSGLATSLKVATGVPHRFSHIYTILRQVHPLGRKQLLIYGAGDKRG